MSRDNNSQQHEVQLSSLLSGEAKLGYQIADIEEINPRYRCLFCSLIIREPVQLSECGHRCCRDCSQIKAASDTEEGITCPLEDCHEVTKKNEIFPDRAFKKELDILRVGCMHQKDPSCNWTGPLIDYQRHLDEVHIQYECRICKKSFGSEVLLEEHLRICSEMFEECRLGTICTADMIPKADYLNHLHSAKHQESIMKFLTGDHQISAPANHEEENQMHKEWENNISERLENLSDGLRRLQIESGKLDDSFQTVYQYFISIVQDVNTLRISTNDRLAIRQEIQPSQEKLQREVEQVHQLCDDTHHIYTDGTLTWRIENVSEKLADAQSERQTSIFSPIFYSSPNGYRMRARLFPFGDGNARRTHISIFFMLMKGEYDSILKWPFHYKVTFCLLDQTGQNHHVIDSFYPDVKSNSFQRPRENANVASGIPKFCPLPMLLQDDNAFVRDNTMFIRIVIALNETPRSLLPFMLTLNPALPTHVQDALISQEAAKQQAAATTTTTTTTSP